MVHFIWHVMTERLFFTSSDQSRYTLWSCQNVCDALSYLLDNIYIRFGTKLYRQIVGIPMGTNCAPLVADLFLYCYERDFMDSLNHDNQADVIEAFNSTSRYLDDLLNIDNPSTFPFYLPLNVFTASKGSNLYILFAITAAGLCRVAAVKSLPVHHP